MKNVNSKKNKKTSFASTLTVMQADSATNPLLQIIQSLAGSGINVSNVQTTLPKTSNIYGSFSGGTGVIGIANGLIMTSGSVFNVLGPNISPSTSQDNGLPGYFAIDTAGFDAAVISFDITSSTSFLSFKYVFASEEYNEYVGSQFNDDFAFLISGPGIPSGTNIAIIPGTNHAVDINDINLLLNPQYYINNDSIQNADPARFQALEYDGLTKVLVTSAIKVVPGATYNVTLVIQDVADAVYDSGVFIEGGSITSDSCVLNVQAEKENIVCHGENNGSIELEYSGANGTVHFLWSNGATTENIDHLAPGSYNVTVTDSIGCKASLSSPLVITEPSAIILDSLKINNASCGGGNDGSATLTASGGVPPYKYTVDSTTNTSGNFTNLSGGNHNYVIADSNNCEITGTLIIPQSSNLFCSIVVMPNPTVTGQVTNTIFLGYGPQFVKLKGSATNGTAPYNFNWGSAGTGDSIVVSPTTTTTYSLIVTDVFGCQSTCNVTIYVKDVRCGNNFQKVIVCHKASSKRFQAICINSQDVANHLAHGDYLGNCNIAAKSTTEMDEDMGKNQEINANSLYVKVFPNPSSNYFTIQVGTEGVKEKINLRILDLNGHKIDEMLNLNSGQMIELGLEYENGIYIAEFSQGVETLTMKLIKGGN